METRSSSKRVRCTCCAVVEFDVWFIPHGCKGRSCRSRRFQGRPRSTIRNAFLRVLAVSFWLPIFFHPLQARRPANVTVLHTTKFIPNLFDRALPSNFTHPLRVASAPPRFGGAKQQCRFVCLTSYIWLSIVVAYDISGLMCLLDQSRTHDASWCPSHRVVIQVRYVC